MSAASRIALDPEEVRGLATRMRGGAFIFSDNGRALANSSLPPMPAALATQVSETICDVNAALQDLAVELIEDASQLEARANWAELGGGAATAWLVPGLRRYPSLPTVPVSPVAEAAPVTEEQIRASQEWAVEILDGMHDSVRALDEEIERLGPRADEVFGKDLVDVFETHADEIPVKALGRFTLAAGLALDVAEHWHEGWLEAGGRAGLSAGGGALGTGLCMLFFSPTGWGIVGCVVGGGLVGSSGGDYVGDQVFDD